MVIWGSLGGSLENNSKQRLIMAYDHPEKPHTWAHSYLEPGTGSDLDLDVDGFRAFDTSIVVIFSSPLTGRVTPHQSWWKIRNGQIVVVNDGKRANELEFSFLTDNGFGMVTWALMPEQKTDADFGWQYGKETLYSRPR